MSSLHKILFVLLLGAIIVGLIVFAVFFPYDAVMGLMEQRPYVARGTSVPFGPVAIILYVTQFFIGITCIWLLISLALGRYSPSYLPNQGLRSSVDDSSRRDVDKTRREPVPSKTIVISDHISGDLIEHHVHISADTEISGSVVAFDVAIEGTVWGNVYALAVDLRQTSVVAGNIVHRSLVLESGAQFTSSVTREEDPFAVLPDDLKDGARDKGLSLHSVK